MAYGGPAVAPTAPPGGSETARQVKLDKECELRVEVGPNSPLRLRMLSGTAEIFGTEIPPEIWLNFPPGQKFTVFTWHGATIEMDGTTETHYTIDETPMISYVNVDAVASGSGFNNGPQMSLDEGNIRKAYVYFKMYASAYKQWKESDLYLGSRGDGTHKEKFYRAQEASRLETANHKYDKMRVLHDRIEKLRFDMFCGPSLDRREQLKALQIHDKIWVEGVDEVKAVAFLDDNRHTFTFDVYATNTLVSTALSEKNIVHQMGSTPSDDNVRTAFQNFCRAFASYQAMNKKHERLMVKMDKAKDAFERANTSLQQTHKLVERCIQMASQKSSSSDDMECFSQYLLNCNHLFVDDKDALINFVEKSCYEGTIHPSDEIKNLNAIKNLNSDSLQICKCEPAIMPPSFSPPPFESELPELPFFKSELPELPFVIIGDKSKLEMTIRNFVKNHASSSAKQNLNQQPLSQMFSALGVDEADLDPPAAALSVSVGADHDIAPDDEADLDSPAAALSVSDEADIDSPAAAQSAGPFY